MILVMLVFLFLGFSVCLIIAFELECVFPTGTLQEQVAAVGLFS